MEEEGSPLPGRKKKVGSDDPPPGVERRHGTREQAIQAIRDDIDPMKHAGEGWFPTEEYARPADIHDRYVRGDIAGEGDYYPGPARKGEKPWPPHRKGR